MSTVQHLYIRPRNEVRSRLDILDLQKNKKQFTLFIQAYSKMLVTDSNDATSFYQLGGIHGIPYQSFVGEPQGLDTNETGWQGYCHHGMPTFPSWHRAYVLYIENAMLYHASIVLEEYKNNNYLYEHLKEELTHLRFPFLKWDVHDWNIPDLFLQTEVTVIGPDGNDVSVRNPLYSYIFQEDIPQTGPLDQGNLPLVPKGTPTIRWGTDTYPKDYVPQPNQLKFNCNLYSKATIYPGLFQMFLNDDYESFSNHYNVIRDGKVDNDTHTPKTSDGHGGGNVYGWLASLEVVHDAMHDCFGGFGQMSLPAVAGLDPIFFLHHCNVDRIFAIWQASNYGGKYSWFDNTNKDETSNAGTFTIHPDEQIKSTTKLTPFRVGEDGKDYIISDQVRNWEDWGYTYPDVQDKLYEKHPHLFKFGLLSKFVLNDPTVIDAVTWTLHVTNISKKYRGGAYQIHAYLTDPGADHEQHPLDKKEYIGSIPVFSLGPQCTSCQISNTVNGQLNLNRAMVRNQIDVTPEPDVSHPNDPLGGNAKNLAAAIVLVFTDKRGFPIAPPPEDDGPLKLTKTVSYKYTEKLSFALTNNEDKKKKIVDVAIKKAEKLSHLVKPNFNMVNFAKEFNLSRFEDVINDFNDNIHGRKVEE